MTVTVTKIAPHSIKFRAMGSLCEIQIYADRWKAPRIGNHAIALVKQLEAKYSRYLPDSVTSKINATAGSEAFMEVDEETAYLLDYAGVLHEQSDGLFDITSGVLRRLWNFNEPRLPTDLELQSLLPSIGWKKVDWQSPRIRLPHPYMEIDFGGFVKEYAADVVANYCKESGVEHGLVNLGGDIHVMGPHPDGAPWQVGIQHPRVANSAIAYIELESGAIATSGDYERYMMVNSRRYSHLLNPLTGESIQPRYASASVIAPQCIVAGSFSTIALLKSATDPQWLEEAELPYLLVDQRMQLSGSVVTAH